jgi:hypothetical protein
MAIPEISKPDNAWCGHCEIGKGCSIYEQRPQMCRDFFCLYISDPTLDERWNPLNAHFVLRAHEKCIFVQVDPQRPDAWKHEPYYSALRNCARAIYPSGMLIYVKIGDRTIMLTPECDVDLASGDSSEGVTIRPIFAPSGVRWEAVNADGHVLPSTPPSHIGC